MDVDEEMEEEGEARKRRRTGLRELYNFFCNAISCIYYVPILEFRDCLDELTSGTLRHVDMF